MGYWGIGLLSKEVGSNSQVPTNPRQFRHWFRPTCIFYSLRISLRITSHWPTLAAFVASTLDYCNALLCSAPAATFDALLALAACPKQSNQSRSVLRMNSLHTRWHWPSSSYGQTSSIQKLQRCQRVKNSAALIVLQAPRRSHTKLLVRQLQWLAVQQRITYKLAVLTFKVRTTSMPTYLSHHIITCDSVRRADSTCIRSTTSIHSCPSRSFVRTSPGALSAFLLHTPGTLCQKLLGTATC